MNSFINISASLLCLLPLAKTQAKTQQENKKMNVLFLIVDDLRPDLNCYGQKQMITPNIDKLAANGVQFNQAYCNIPVSGASRASIMTGLRPTRERWWDVNALIEKEAPDAITLPKYFKENGYTTVSNSKVIHGKKDATDSWNKIWKPKAKGTWRNYLDDENLDNEKEKGGAYAYECLDVADDAYIDGKTARKTINDLKRFKESNEPFFLAVGIVKPHLPFNAPKKYWDLYDENDIRLPDNFNLDRSGFPEQAFHNWNELRHYKNIQPKTGQVEVDEAKRLIRGYKACVSYADAQVGTILQSLKDLGLNENTIVILIGDHGWSLGEHGDWCKHSNFTIVNRAPMIISAPGLPKNKKIDSMVEFVDIYPTLCNLAGLNTPQQLEGENMVGLMQGTDKNWKNTAIIKWHEGLTYMTPEYRYTEWRDKEDKLKANMLFNIINDNNENKNIVKKVENKNLIDKLSKELKAKRGSCF